MDFKVKTRGGKVIGEKEARWVPTTHSQDGEHSVSAFESYVMASRQEKDVLREKLKDAEKNTRLLEEARNRLGYAESRYKSLEKEVGSLRNQLEQTSRQHGEAKDEKRRLKNLNEMLKEENNLQKGQIYSLTTLQEAYVKKIEELKLEVSIVSLCRDDRKGPGLCVEDFSCECTVCLDDFDNQKVIPVVWQCGHMVCESCTDKMIECPTCREDKQYVSAKCIEYLRVVELIRKMNEKAKEKANSAPDRID